MSRRTLSLVAAVAALGGVLASLPLAAQQPDRSAPPRPGDPPTLKLPAIVKQQLSNGLPVWIVEHHEVPIVQVNLLVHSGSAADPADRYGVASLTAAMLDEGAGGKPALELSDAIEFLGAELSTASSFDSSAVRMSAPVARLDQALPLMADVALRPDFPAAELERLRKEQLTALLQARDNPAAIVGIAFPRLVFGPTHRYGTSASGTEATLAAITTDDLRAFYRARYRPDNATLIVVGDVTPAGVLPLLERAFGGWTSDGPAAAPAAVPAAPQLTARQIYLIDKPGAAQSQIRIGWVGVPRSTPDYAVLQVLNTILGGSFTSRLNTNLRETHGYSYGAGSVFDARRAPGPFFAAAGVQTDKTSEALQEFFNELNGIRTPIPAAEVEKAKNYVALGFPSEFETTRDLAAKLEEQIVFGLPDDYYATFIDRIRAVTPQAVEAAAARYIAPDKFAVVVVGDRQVVEAKVRALGLGPVTLVPVDDVFK